MGYRDGNTVKELIGRGEPVRVKMQVDIDYRDGLKTASIFGTLPGTTDEEIYVLATSMATSKRRSTTPPASR